MIGFLAWLFCCLVRVYFVTGVMISGVKMELEQYLRLRSFEKPATKLYKAIVVALVIHAGFGANWYFEKNNQKAEIPDFINVRLTAGVEVVKENKKPVKKKSETVNKEALKPLKKKEKTVTKQARQQPVVKEINQRPAKATTFVAADSRPYMLDNPKPVYPASARRRGMQGVVLLSVKVNEKGYVERLNVLGTSGYRVLDRSALASVEKWRFVPAKRGGQSVASTMQIPVRFILKNI